LHQLAEKLRGLEVVHVNSTSEGEGVAEILAWMTPLMCDLGLDAKWKVIRGTPGFFAMTKSIHNGLQGKSVALTKKDWDTYFDVKAENLAELRGPLENADIVVIHDPQPAPLLQLCPARKAKWIWRAHIDVSRPDRHVWKSLRSYVDK